MTKPRTEFLRTISERGFIHQCTDLAALDRDAANARVTAYVGYDCTADSLHVGHLVSIMMLRWLQKTGHRPIALMGGGTTKVGDPSGKDETRQLLSEQTIAANMAAIKRSFANFLSFDDGPTGAIMVNNADWLDELPYIAFLRDIGRHFSVNRMLSLDSVKLRLDREQPLSFLEFNYMVLQSYDFVELARRYDCRLQMGGSDQWGNIVMGVELGRRVGDFELFGLTTPLITTASGAKMGKTAQGAVWLNPDRMAPYAYYQYWRNTDDADVGRFLKLFTEIPLDEIAKVEELADAEINEAKKILAFEATKLCHGEIAAREAAETARRTFEEGAIGEDLPKLHKTRAELKAGVPLYQLLVEAGLSATNSEARRHIQQGGVRLNDRVVTDIKASATDASVTKGGFVKLTRGKKHHALVIVIENGGT